MSWERGAKVPQYTLDYPYFDDADSFCLPGDILRQCRKNVYGDNKPLVLSFSLVKPFIMIVMPSCMRQLAKRVQIHVCEDALYWVWNNQHRYQCGWRE